MLPEYQLFFNIAAGIIGSFGALLLRSQLDAIKDLQKSHADLVQKHASIEVLVAGNYAKKDDVDRLGSAIFAKLDKIENKLDQKADKT